MLTTERLCVKVSKPYLPWYEPVPELPTPPKGALGTPACIATSFMVTPPDCVCERTEVYSLVGQFH